MHGAALAGVFQLFQDQDAGAFADDESVAGLIPGTAGFFGIIVASGERPHGGESAHAHGSDRGLGATRDHHIGIVVLDDPEGIANGMRAGGAGGRRRLVRSLGSVTHGNMPGRQIDNGGGNKEGRNLARAAFHERDVLAFDDVEPADARTDVNADALVILRRDLESRHFHGFIGGGDRHVNEAPHLLDFFFLDEVQRVEVLDLGGDLAGEGGGVKPGNPGDAAFAGKHGLPHVSREVAHAADQAEAGDYDPASQIYFPAFACLPM